MKHLSNILLVTLFAVALMQLYRAHMELRYNCEALAWQVKCENDQLMVLLGTNFQRTHRDAQKIAELEAKLNVAAASKNQIN